MKIWLAALGCAGLAICVPVAPLLPYLTSSARLSIPCTTLIPVISEGGGFTTFSAVPSFIFLTFSPGLVVPDGGRLCPVGGLSTFGFEGV